ncbi:MAG: isoleucine--tRNA ligase [Patescibacteria group bacterium]
MKFKKNTRRKAIEYEKDLVQYWKQNKTFEKSVEAHPKEDAYVFYDGPPFITGVPHHGTLLSSIVKDAVPRYWTMKGKRVERVWGWDCHGLPAENFVEQQLGITDRRDIGTKISLEEYITKARESMVANSQTWEAVIDRIGRWVDFKGAYKTMDKDYMESVWWAFKTLYDKGKIYEGYKVLMYDTKFATPVSKAEVTMDNDAYQTVTDPSVYVKFKLTDGDTSLLAWTTTPWTLPGNTALAVNETLVYVEVEVDGQKLIMAKDLTAKVLTDEKHTPLTYKILRELKGSELVGKIYEPLFDDRDFQLAHTVAFHNQDSKDYVVLSADYVSDESGTGIVHIAPCYGEEDFELAKAQGIRLVEILDENGIYYPEVPHYANMEVWSSNKLIAKDLKERGIVWKIDYIQHEYPFNPRSKQRIMYRAIPSWFFDIENSKTLMIEKNENINWFPPHLKHGRFQKNIEQAPDWNLSRDRFWATAMPVWKGIDSSGKEHIKVVGSYSELQQLSGVELEDYHRPWVDDVTFTIDDIEYKRIDKVLDGWFESGSMPFAQFHYPFENKEKFEAHFPGDFIVEYIGQVRAWFYYVHAVNTALFGNEAFENVITTGVIAGNDGRKMSKSLNNFTDPNELMDRFSADSLRFLLLSSPLLSGEDFTLQDKEVGDVSRKLSMIWNMYDFFTLYADVDGWEWDGDLTDPAADLENPLDKWIVSRVHQLNQEVDKHMQGYDLANALKLILPFVDDASNWYVRRSRKRFWKSDNDADKASAYRTLHYVLVQLSLVMAPFTPFLSEELYRKLTGGESVHLLDWPESGHVNELLVRDMQLVRESITTGLSIRAKAGIKVRQPLASVTVPATMFSDAQGREELYKEIIAEELNVKEVKLNNTRRSSEERLAKSPLEAGIQAVSEPLEIILDLELTPQLKQEGLMREIIRHVQQSRKQAGLEVDDRIELSLKTEDKALTNLLDNEALTDVILQETLAKSLGTAADNGFDITVKVDGAELQIGITKA